MLLFDYYPQFFTATILEWKHLLQENRYKDIVISSFRFMVIQKRVKIYSFVIMPNHMHLIWQIRDGYKREDVQRDLLKYTAQQIRFDMQKTNPAWLSEFEVNAKDRKYQFWERNALTVDLYTPAVFDQKMRYIHNNPSHIKWGLSKSPIEYHYSSALFYENGVDNWGFLSHYKD